MSVGAVVVTMVEAIGIGVIVAVVVVVAVIVAGRVTASLDRCSSLVQ